jgi:hypothetical protein
VHKSALPLEFAVMPVSSESIARWTSFGGKVEAAKNGRKKFVAPSGKKLKTWKEAQRLLDHEEDGKEGVYVEQALAHLHLRRPICTHLHSNTAVPAWDMSPHASTLLQRRGTRRSSRHLYAYERGGGTRILVHLGSSCSLPGRLTGQVTYLLWMYRLLQGTEPGSARCGRASS